MSWAMIAELMIKFGPSAFDLAKKLVEKWNSPDPVTMADIVELEKLGKRSARDAAIEALVRAGVALDSPQAVAILALLPT